MEEKMSKTILYCHENGEVYSADETFWGDGKHDFYDTKISLEKWKSLSKEQKEVAKEAFKNKVESGEWKPTFLASTPHPDFSDSSSYSFASGRRLKYVVIQVTLKEKLIGTGSGNLTELEDVINHQASLGYRLHTITTANGGSKGLMGGDRIQATMVFERIED